MPEPGPKNDGSTARVVAIIDALARAGDDGVGVRSLALDLKISRSAAHRILQGLSQLHVARALDSGNYEAGEVLAAWGMFLQPRHNLLALAAELLARLVEVADETVYLTVYAGNRLTIVAVEQCSHPIRYVLPVGTTAPLGRGAAGKAVLAHLPDEVISTLALPAKDAAALREDLAQTRARGYATSKGENIPDACGFAAPYFVDGVVAGSISISVPRYRTTASSYKQFGPAAKAAGESLSQLLAPR